MTSQRLLGAIALTSLAAFGTSAGAAVNFQNGGFEELPLTPGTNFVTLAAGSGNLTGWSIDWGSVDHIRDYWVPSQGAQSLDLSGNEPSRISQTFATVPNQPYQVSFDYSYNPDGGSSPRGVVVALVNGATTVNNYAYTALPSPTRPDMNWQTVNFGFTAVGSETTLRFSGYEASNTCCFGTALDNVQVNAVPEAQEWAMMLAGLGLVGWIARRRGGNPMPA